jgi:TIR domain/WD40-like Beta Propeller Repeat
MGGPDKRRSSRIFISYRRQETAYSASWLYDRLSAEFGGAQIFKDVDNLKPGDDFVDSIASAVASCDVLLALMGPNWANGIDGWGRRRIDDPADFVRLEVETALARDVRVIPLLIGDAQMPSRDDLPTGLAPLVRKHALELSPAHFNRDAESLVAVLHEVLAEGRSKSPITEPLPPRSGSSSRAPLPYPDPSPKQGTKSDTEPHAAAVDLPHPTPSPTLGRQVADEDHPTSSTRLNRPRFNGQQSLMKRHRKWVILSAVSLLLLTAGLIFAVSTGHRHSVTVEEPSPAGPADLPRSAEPLPDDSLLWRRERGGEFDVSTIDINGNDGRVLITGKENHGAVLTPDRRTVLYLHENGQSKISFTLHAISADGKGDRLLFSDGSKSCPILGQPAARTDGLLAVPCYEYIDGPSVLNLMSLDGTVIRRLDRGWLGDPTFTHDGQSVVYWRAESYDKQQGGALYKVPVAGAAAATRITDGGDAEDADPACSPTGDAVVFRRAREGRWEIAIIGIPQGEIRTVPSNNPSNQRPSWSPDGSRIVYQQGSNPRAESTLLVVNADGTDERPVKYNKGFGGPPTWTAR